MSREADPATAEHGAPDPNRGAGSATSAVPVRGSALSPARRPAPLPLRIVVVALAAVAVASLGGLAAAHLHRGLLPAPSAAGTTTSAPPRSTTTTSTSLPPSGAGAPLLAALEPSSGRAGDQVTISGTRLVSSGSIIATFDGVDARTSCPSEQRCLVTVPPPPKGSTSAIVRVQTSSGLSNTLTFTYS